MRKGIKTVGNRLSSDMGIDAKAGLKLAVGLGDSDLTAVSLFAMPALDFASGKVRGRVCGRRDQSRLQLLSVVERCPGRLAG